MTRVIALFAAAAVVLGLGVGVFVVLNRGGGDRFTNCRDSRVAGGAAQIGGPFSLVDGDGVRVSDAEVITKPTLIYFGYTFCPDFCPTDLGRNALAADILKKQGVAVGQVFITVDPTRDTPAVMKDYAASIHPDLVGLTGSPAEAAAAANAYRVYFRKSGDDPENYLMDHSTFTYLMAPKTGFLDFFSSDLSAEDLAGRVRCFAKAL